jgi:hypothetical protein
MLHLELGHYLRYFFLQGVGLVLHAARGGFHAELFVLLQHVIERGGHIIELVLQVRQLVAFAQIDAVRQVAFAHGGAALLEFKDGPGHAVRDDRRNYKDYEQIQRHLYDQQRGHRVGIVVQQDTLDEVILGDKLVHVPDGLKPHYYEGDQHAHQDQRHVAVLKAFLDYYRLALELRRRFGLYGIGHNVLFRKALPSSRTIPC